MIQVVYLTVTEKNANNILNNKTPYFIANNLSTFQKDKNILNTTIRNYGWSNTVCKFEKQKQTERKMDPITKI